MFLRITSPDKVIFQGKIKRVTLPTLAGEIGILPGHIPLTSVVKPGIVKILPEEVDQNEFIKNTEFLFDKDEINLSVSKGLAFVDGQTVIVVTSASSTSPEHSEEILIKMKQELEMEMEKLKQKGAVEDIEKVMLSLQKISADLKLWKLKANSRKL